MKSSNKLFIFTGVALALVAVLMAITMSSGGNKVDGQDEANNGKVKVVKAALDLEPYKVIAMSDIVVEEMSAEQAPADAATDVALVVGQSYKLGAIKGDILLSSQLQPPGIRNAISAGMRAASLSVDSQGMMSGLIMDGDYVDVVFHARVDLRRVLQAGDDVEIEEDGPYSLQSIDPAAGDGKDVQQLQGAPGSEFTAVDGGQNLEPVAKILVQNVKVLRVVGPGVQFDGQGQEIQRSPDDTTTADELGQLIIEVTPQQAEAIAFIQDQNHTYEVVVRGNDDAEIVSTTGITFEILMTDGTWSLPWPEPIVVAAADDAAGDAGAESDATAEDS